MSVKKNILNQQQVTFHFHMLNRNLYTASNKSCIHTLIYIYRQKYKHTQHISFCACYEVTRRYFQIHQLPRLITYSIENRKTQGDRENVFSATVFMTDYAKTGTAHDFYGAMVKLLFTLRMIFFFKASNSKMILHTVFTNANEEHFAKPRRISK